MIPKLLIGFIVGLQVKHTEEESCTEHEKIRQAMHFDHAITYLIKQCTNHTMTGHSELDWKFRFMKV